MLRTFYLPDLAEGITSGIVVGHLKGVGDRVEEFEPFIAIQTDKAVVEIPSPWKGIIARHFVEVGKDVSVGTPLTSFICVGYAKAEMIERALTCSAEATGLLNLATLDVDALCADRGSYKFDILRTWFERAKLLGYQLRNAPLNRLDTATSGELEAALHSVWDPIIAIREFRHTESEANRDYGTIVSFVRAEYEKCLAALRKLTGVVRDSARPRVFIGSSTRSLEFARHVSEVLGPEVRATTWRDDVIFQPGLTTNEALEQAVDLYDFGVFVFGNDDAIDNGQGQKRVVPRDNVVFELGLFLGRLSRSRALIIREKDSTVLSNLLGVTTADFESGDSWRQSLSIAATKVKHAIIATWPWKGRSEPISKDIESIPQFPPRLPRHNPVNRGSASSDSSIQ